MRDSCWGNLRTVPSARGRPDLASGRPSFFKMKHRVFIAIPISEKLQKEILQWRRAKLARLDSYVRWLAGKNLHLTLIPPWYVNNPKDATNLLDAIAYEKLVRGFVMEFRRVAFGPLEPPRGKPRLIWVEGPTPAPLKNFDTRERRPFRLHLTLARFRPEDFSQFPIKKLNEPVSWREEVKEIVLMESHLSPQGADYEIIFRKSL